MRMEGGRWLQSGAVAAGQSLVIELSGAGAAGIIVLPLTGGTAQLSVSRSELADVRNDSALWVSVRDVTDAGAEVELPRALTAIKLDAAVAAADYALSQDVHA